MDPVLVRLVLVVLLVAVVGLAGGIWRRRDGRVRAAPAAPGRAVERPGRDAGHADEAGPRPARARRGHVAAAPALSAAQLAAVGLDLEGVRTGGVLLTSPTCVSCGTVARLLAELAEARGDLRWVAVEASRHLDVVREHRVLRAPTLFLLDPQGGILARVSGVPDRADLVGVLDRPAPARAEP